MNFISKYRRELGPMSSSQRKAKAVFVVIRNTN